MLLPLVIGAIASAMSEKIRRDRASDFLEVVSKDPWGASRYLQTLERHELISSQTVSWFDSPPPSIYTQLEKISKIAQDNPEAALRLMMALLPAELHELDEGEDLGGKTWGVFDVGAGDLMVQADDERSARLPWPYSDLGAAGDALRFLDSGGSAESMGVSRDQFLGAVVATTVLAMTQRPTEDVVGEVQAWLDDLER
jgi:hypothetical protein